MKFLKKLFSKKEVKMAEAKPIDPTNYNYVCIPFDPINTVNDLTVGDWNMGEVRKSLAMGMLRYAKQSEVDKARELRKIKTGGN